MVEKPGKPGFSPSLSSSFHTTNVKHMIPHHYACRGFLLALLLVLAGAPVFAQPIAEPVDDEAVAAIRKHGLDQSQVMETLEWLTDVHGPRLTGSPKLDEASQWILGQLEAWGLENNHLEEWGPFGRGWTLDHFSAHVTAPNPFPILAYPKAWSPGTDGPLTAEVVIYNPETEEDYAALDGKLAGKIVLVQELREVDEPFEPLAARRDDSNLLNLANWAGADERSFPSSESRIRQFRQEQERTQFLYDQNPAAILDPSSCATTRSICPTCRSSARAGSGTTWRGWRPRCAGRSSRSG
jgi:hypothetical protein